MISFHVYKHQREKVEGPSILPVSEMVAISLLGQVYEIRCIKRLYELVKDCFADDFRLPSYKSFVVGMNSVSRYLLLFINTLLSTLAKQSYEYAE
ncbi:MAG: hypothetical protein H7196_05300 [candidate division SR1 bacterium]|nr:hypothetical protein [candidate division SR1 bacterium]